MRLRLAAEAIDFQRNDSFGKELEKLIAEMQEYVKNSKENEIVLKKDLQESEWPNKISNLILARTGIKTTIEVNTDVLAACMPLWINKNHILLKDYWRDDFSMADQEKFIKNNNNNKGWVDLKQAKVGGMFSQFDHTIWLDIVTMERVGFNFTAKEITAILLHELGHLFTTLEYSDRLESTNQVMQSLAFNLKSNGNVSERNYLLKELVKASKDSADVKDLEKENNRIIFGVKLFRKYIELVKSQMPHDKYDETASEQLADNFASKFGYSKELITGLDKLHKLFGSPEKSRSVRIFNSLGVTLFYILGIVKSLTFMFIGAIPGGVLLLAIIMLFFYVSGEASADYTYDELKIRYKRIRQQYIEMLSQLKLSRDEMKNIIANVDFVDKIIQDTVIYKDPIRRLSNFVFSKNRHAKADIELQQFIEELTHNDLFLASAKLQTLEISH